MANRRASVDPTRWHLRTRLAFLLAAVALACGPAGEPQQEAAAPAAPESPPPPLAVAPDPAPTATAEAVALSDLESISGVYRMNGVTVQANTGRLRDVSGTVTLQGHGDGYTATIDLSTLYPTSTGDIPAEIEGKAFGRLVGKHLVGSAETRMRPAAGVGLSGADGAPAEELVVVSSSLASIDEHGKLNIQLLNDPAPGQDFSPSITVLSGVPEDRPVAKASPVSDSTSGLPPVSAPAPPASGLERISGVYRVDGVTVQANTGRLRDVSGTVTLQGHGNGYTATIDLSTLYPTSTGDIPAEIEGKAFGRQIGDHLVGTAQTQMRPAAGVGISGTGGAPAEELVVVSSSVASVDENGKLDIQLLNDPAPGQDYSPSVTVLSGTRLRTTH